MNRTDRQTDGQTDRQHKQTLVHSFILRTFKALLQESRTHLKALPVHQPPLKNKDWTDAWNLTAGWTTSKERSSSGRTFQMDSQNQTHRQTDRHTHTRGTWWRLGWVDSFQPEGRGFDSRSGQVLYMQLPVRFGVKLRYSIRAVVGSASE